jgi:alpha-galactosidase
MRKEKSVSRTKRSTATSSDSGGGSSSARSNTAKERLDEWVFHVANTELRQRQPRNVTKYPDESVEVEDNTDELSSLLETPKEQAFSWNFRSPFWSFSNSAALLTITYSPAWQNIPEYTQQCASCGSSASKCRIGCLFLCGKTTQPSIEYVAEIFTIQDIVRTEEQITVRVEEIGECQAVRLYLRPLSIENNPVPESLQDAWNDHVQRMNTNVDEKPEFDHNGPVLTFAISKSSTDPPLLWNVWIPAIPDHPVAVQTISILDGNLQTPGSKPQPTHIYIHGYQSWSFTGSLLRGRMQPKPALPSTFSKAFNLGGSPPPKPNTIYCRMDNIPQENHVMFQKWYKSDFFTCVTSDGSARPSFSERKFPYQSLDETGGPALILGWLSQHEQFGIVTANRDLSHFQMHCSVDGQILLGGNCIKSDWGYVQLVSPHSYDEEPMANYLHSVASYNKALPLQRSSLLTGWCSWYVFYENINSNLLCENVKKLVAMRDHVPTNVAVVDDGYMTSWGDWDSLKPGDFEGGMELISKEISENGMQPGIWLAPFAADKGSVLAREHSDWIIKNNAGLSANSSNCGKFFYGLDATNPAVRNYVHESIRRAVEDWKFNVLKIDFLYAACLYGNGKHDLSMSRAQTMHLALKTIRDAAGPDVFLVGCGCPIATGIGYVDAMRISADTGPTWYPALPLPWWDNGTLPSLRGMVRNSITRAPFGHRWWHNDPDCLMLGLHTSLTDDEVASAASIIAMTCGMLLLSDDLPTVSSSRMSILSKIFPLTGVTAVVLDLHSTTDGLPSLMRLWCTDKYKAFDSYQDSMDIDDNNVLDHNAEATHFARMASFNPAIEVPDPTERRRSCIHVTNGLGTWTVVSLSNWSDKSCVVRVPPPALLPPPEYGWAMDDSDDDDNPDKCSEENAGFHVFGFWSSKYSWLANPKENDNDDPNHTVCKNLRPHQTEVFHIKRVTPDTPQYIGKRQLSDLFLNGNFF